MNNSLIKLISCILCSGLISVSLSGCQTGGPKQTGGHIIGGITGAVLGSQFGKGDGRVVAGAIGAIAGSMLGGHIGSSLDAQDKKLAYSAAQRTLELAPDHEVRTWHNPNSGHSGEFIIKNTEERPEQHLVCRNYIHTVNIDGRLEEVHGRACRDLSDPKGQWKIN